MSIPVMQHNDLSKVPIDVYLYYNPGSARKMSSYFGAVNTPVGAVCGRPAPEACAGSDFLVTVLDTAGRNGVYTGTNAEIPSDPAPIGAAVDGDVPLSGEDKGSVWCLPDPANNVLICYDKGITADPGEQFKPVPRKCNPVDHYVRVRSQPTLSLTDTYIANNAGLSRIRGVEVTLIAFIQPECADVASEVIYFTNVLFQNVPILDSTGTEDEPMQFSATGSFGQFMSFTPPIV